jgi:hypothetical protein
LDACANASISYGARQRPIELKADPDEGAIGQVARYAAHLRASPELVALIGRLGAAMALLYGCTKMPARLRTDAVRAMVAWPGADGFVVRSL